MFKSLNPKAYLLMMIALSITGWSAYAFADTLSKLLVENYNIHQILMINGTLVTFFLGNWIYWKRGWRGFASKKIKWHIARGVLIGFVSICGLNALARIPLADFYGIIFLSPFLVLLMAAAFLKEYIGWRRCSAVAVGFAGVLILAGPQFLSLNIGVVLAFLTAFLISTCAILIRKIGPGEFLPLYGFFPSLFIFLVNTPLAIPHFQVPKTADVWLFALQGPLVLIGLLSVTYAIAHVKESNIIAPFHYIQIVWGVALGYVIFGDIPTFTTLSGISIIVSAGLYTIWREYHLAHAED